MLLYENKYFTCGNNDAIAQISKPVNGVRSHRELKQLKCDKWTRGQLID